MPAPELESHRRTVITKDSEVSYLDVGSGPLALFVHGVGTNAYLWRNVFSAMADERRCIALDLPLHGHTPARDDQDLSLTGLARVVEDFCDALGLDGIDLVAHDTGGAVAQVFAAHDPRRLATLTLTNCDTHDNVPPEAFLPTVELARQGALAPAAPALLEDLAAARAAVFASGYQDIEKLDLDTVQLYLQPVIGTYERALQFERLLVSLSPTDLLAVEPALRALQVPTLVVWGSADVFFDISWAYWLRETIPGVTEVVEVPGGHLFFPDERAEDLVCALRRHWSLHRVP